MEKTNSILHRYFQHNKNIFINRYIFIYLLKYTKKRHPKAALR